MSRNKVSYFGMIWIMLIYCGISMQSDGWCLEASEGTDGKAGVQQGQPIYRPPLRGMPFSREGGATRGDKDSLAVITALVPEHIGLTSIDMPVLYWHASRAVEVPIEFAIIDDNAIEPLYQVSMKPPFAAGYHAVRLQDGLCKLELHKVYKWFIAMVVDSQHRSRDIVVSGAIERVKLSDQLRSRIQQASLFDQISMYADAGIWFDAVDCLNRFVEEQKGSATALKLREDFFRQVGLTLKTD
ncbi:DUF928 domain-containing protein [Desulfatirhabdium butyrativorans]|uniref:DUF928 domain-containing protein n=1 Tax=Desulfatirhabdium butyrativorans TaxID=340467 RepID=UPI00048399E3|nr:DUF928 domain-containing protein [Desulfatirhabdium butyrativorans]